MTEHKRYTVKSNVAHYVLQLLKADESQYIEFLQSAYLPKNFSPLCQHLPFLDFAR